MGTFDVHSDAFEMEPMRAPAGLGATGLFVSMDAWTSRHGRSGYVPDSALIETYGTVDALAGDIDRLVEAGLWQREGDGYRMLRGPHADPDLPLPLWRYTDTAMGGRLFATDDTLNN